MDHQKHNQHHDHSNHHAMMADDFRRRFWLALVLSVPILALSPSIQQWFGFVVPSFVGRDLLLFVLASVVALYTAWPFYTHGFAELRRGRLGMMVLVSLAVGLGYVYSVATTFFIDAPDFYWEIATLVVILLLGHWMEMRAVVGTSGALNALVKLIPPTANRQNEKGEIDVVDTATLHVGDTILVRPGEKIPIDGEVVGGESSVNESLITGESKPVRKTVGSTVIGGALNVDGSLTVRITKTGKDTALAQIVQLVRGAQSSKPSAQRLADRAAHYLTLIAIIVGVLTFVSWNWVFGASFVFALTLTMTVVVITCPHALGLAIPTVTTITSTLAARSGILVKDMEGLEKARDITTVVFDKTGTLTKGEFGVSNVVAFDGDESSLLALAAAVERNSEHVIARAIVAEAETRSLTLPTIDQFRAVPGKGVVAMHDLAPLAIGTKLLMIDQNISVTSTVEQQVGKLQAQGKTVLYVAREKTVVGIIALADLVKDESAEAITRLKNVGVKVAMLTGDNEATARYVARVLNLDTYFAEVLPEDKVSAVRELQAKGERVMMVGDGVNDAPALTQADVGVAIGAGTDVAIESAEIVLVKNNPLDIVKLIRLSRATMRKMRQNLVWATGYNLIAIPVAAGVLYPWGIVLRPEWGALAMTASSIIVVINALLLRRTSLN